MGTKFDPLYPVGMGMNFFYGDGDGYGIAKPVPALPRCHPYLGACKIEAERLLCFGSQGTEAKSSFFKLKSSKKQKF